MTPARKLGLAASGVIAITSFAVVSAALQPDELPAVVRVDYREREVPNVVPPQRLDFILPDLASQPEWLVQDFTNMCVASDGWLTAEPATGTAVCEGVDY